MIGFEELFNRTTKLAVKVHKKGGELNYLRVFVSSCLRGFFGLRMRRLISFIIIGATLLVVLTEGFSAPLKLKDATGTSFRFSSPPQRIISLAPSITESLYQLGAGKKIVGVTIYAPAEAGKKEKIGEMLTPSIEKIVSLNPDLVLITRDGNRPQTRDTLRRLGIKVFTFGESRSFSDIKEHFLLLGKIVGEEKKARQVVKEASLRVEEVEKRIGPLPPVKVFFEVWTKPLITVAKGTFLDEMIRMAGGINIAHEARVRYPRYSREAVIEKNPGVILLETGNGSLERQKEEWHRLLRARICRVDRNLVAAPIPLVFAEGVEKVARRLHPEVFKQR